MKVLLTNDDGIHAEGIRALYEQIKDLCEVIVVAPDREKSASSHAITLGFPLKMKRNPEDPKGFYAVTGFPADCVKFAIREICKNKKPDLVFSGINHGGNLGVNVLYSGTVAGAVEGALHGIPSIAFSVDSHVNPCLDVPLKMARRIVEMKMHKELSLEGALLNINVPNIDPKQIKGVKATTQGHTLFAEHFEKKEIGGGEVEYFLGGEKEKTKPQEGSDEMLSQQHYVTVTPLQCDLTDYELLAVPRPKRPKGFDIHAFVKYLQRLDF